MASVATTTTMARRMLSLNYLTMAARHQGKRFYSSTTMPSSLLFPCSSLLFQRRLPRSSPLTQRATFAKSFFSTSSSPPSPPPSSSSSSSSSSPQSPSSPSKNNASQTNKSQGKRSLFDPKEIPVRAFEEAIVVKNLPDQEDSKGEDDMSILPEPTEIPLDVGPETVSSFEQLSGMILSRVNAHKKYYERRMKEDYSADPVKRRELEEMAARFVDLEDELMNLTKWIAINVDEEENPSIRNLLDRLFKITRELPVDQDSETVPESYFEEFGQPDELDIGGPKGGRFLQLNELPPDPKGIHNKNVLRKEMEDAVPKIDTCIMCREKIKSIDPMNVGFLHNFLSDTGLILAKKVSGNCAKHQRKIARTIKRSRHLGLFTYKKGVFEINNPYEDFEDMEEIEEKTETEAISGLTSGLHHILMSGKEESFQLYQPEESKDQPEEDQQPQQPQQPEQTQQPPQP